MTLYLTVLLWFSSASVGHFLTRNSLRTTNFCDIKCGLKKHICCIYGSDFGKECTNHPAEQYIEEWEKDLIVKMHNSIRNEVAGGNATRKDLRGLTASNMYTLSYSNKLAYTASCWAKQCIQSQSRCRSIETGHVGEAMCWTRGLTTNLKNISFDLLARCPRNFLTFFPRFDKQIIDRLELPLDGDDERNRETVQLIWAETRYVGCSRVSYPDEERGYSNVLIVCHYYPAGNILTESIFIRGPPCSQCGDEVCSKKYPNLCGEIRSLMQDVWIPTFYKASGVKYEISAILIALLIIIESVIKDML